MKVSSLHQAVLAACNQDTPNNTRQQGYNACVTFLSSPSNNPFKKDKNGKMAIDLAYEAVLADDLNFDARVIFKLLLENHCAIGVNWSTLLPATIDLDDTLIVGHVLSLNKPTAPIFLNSTQAKNPAIQLRIEQAEAALSESSGNLANLKERLSNAKVRQRYQTTNSGIDFLSITGSSNIIPPATHVDLPGFLKMLDDIRKDLAELSSLALVYAPTYRMTSDASLHFSDTLGKVSKTMTTLAVALLIVYNITLIVIALLGRVYREDDEGHLINDKDGNPIPRFDENAQQRLRLAAFGGNGILALTLIAFMTGMLLSHLKIAPQQLCLLVELAKTYRNRKIILAVLTAIESQLPPALDRLYQIQLKNNKCDLDDYELRIESLIIAIENYSNYLIPDPCTTLPTIKKPTMPNKSAFWQLASTTEQTDEETPLYPQALINN